PLLPRLGARPRCRHRRMDGAGALPLERRVEPAAAALGGSASLAGPGTIVSWAMNNVWDTNFPPTQEGETAFGYAVASASPDADARELGMCTAAALTRPLVGVLGARGGTPQTAALGSFRAVHPADV